MARVTGIGGFFFRARDPDALNRWYADHLGVINPEAQGYDDPGWFQDRGETVFFACEPGSTTPGPPDKQWSINFRVDDLDGMVEYLRGEGIEVEPHPQEYPNGRFAELADPEGNHVQLWEPNAASVARDPGPVIVTGHLELDPADRDAFVADRAEFVRAARSAPGCLDFAMSADTVEPGRVNILERWESKQALHAFRGDGPDDDSAARVLDFDVHDYAVASP